MKNQDSTSQDFKNSELNGLLEQLETLSVLSLRQVRERADKLIGAKEDAEKESALAEIKSLIEERGLTGEEVRKHIFPPKYLHPDDASKTWSGKGKKATWIQDEIDEGRKPENFLNPAWKDGKSD